MLTKRWVNSLRSAFYLVKDTVTGGSGSHSFSAFQQGEIRASISKIQFENSQGRTLTGPPGLHIHPMDQSLLPGGRGQSWYGGSSIDHRPSLVSGTRSYGRICRKHTYDCNQLPISTTRCLLRKPSWPAPPYPANQPMLTKCCISSIP